MWCSLTFAVFWDSKANEKYSRVVNLSIRAVVARPFTRERGVPWAWGRKTLQLSLAYAR